MSNICAASTCLNGNCVGCKNGVVYCEDPRCFPNCAGCSSAGSNNSNWVIVTIILVLLGVLLIMSFIIGYSWFGDRKKANEPKNITVNKHTHTVTPVVMPPRQVISQPMISQISQPVISQPVFQTSKTPSFQVVEEPTYEPVSYNGMNLSMEGISSNPIKNCNPKINPVVNNCNSKGCPIQGLE